MRHRAGTSIRTVAHVRRHGPTRIRDAIRPSASVRELVRLTPRPAARTHIATKIDKRRRIHGPHVTQVVVHFERKLTDIAAVQRDAVRPRPILRATTAWNAQSETHQDVLNLFSVKVYVRS